MPDDSMPEMAILSSPEQGRAKSTSTDEVFPDEVFPFKSRIHRNVILLLTK